MDLMITILQHPLTAVGIAGFVTLQVYQLVRWAEHRTNVDWWLTWVEEAATVYLHATGKNLADLEAHDVAQIAAAAGCPASVAVACLHDLRRARRGVGAGG